MNHPAFALTEQATRKGLCWAESSLSEASPRPEAQSHVYKNEDINMDAHLLEQLVEVNGCDDQWFSSVVRSEEVGIKLQTSQTRAE